MHKGAAHESAALSSTEEVRFDLANLARAEDRANRSKAWLGLGVAIGAACVLGFFAVIFVLAGFTYQATFIAYAVLFGLLIALGVYLYRVASGPRSPVAVIVGPDGLEFDYARASSKAVSWDEPGDLVWLLDQHLRVKNRLTVGSDYGCRMRSERFVVGYYSPITREAHDYILSMAKEQGVSVNTHPFTLPRGVILKDVTIHHLYRPKA